MANTRVTNPVTGFKSATEKGLKLPSGTNANQPSGVQGMIRNDTGETTGSSASAIEHHNGTNWQYFAATESADNPFYASQNFNTVLYTGTGVSNPITGVGFQPDLVWIKARNTGYNHRLFDSVRTLNGRIESNTTAAEVSTTQFDNFASFDSNGFTLGVTSSTNGSNFSGEPFVAWCWKAGGAAVANTDGDITSQVSANVAAGFSIVSWSGDGSDMDIGHGLDAAPEMVIRKDLISSVDWMVDTSVIDGSWDYLKLNTTGSKTNHTYVQSPTSTVFNTMGANYNSSGMIAYCFHSVPGYSKIGSYIGNGSTSTGKTIDLGFEPAFIVIKNTTTTGSSSGWFMIDNKRNTSDPWDKYIFANNNAAEGTTTASLTSVGATSFTVKSSGRAINYLGDNYIYMAFATS